MPTKDAVLAALRAVPGPDGRTPLPESGALSDVAVEGGKVFLAITVPARAARAAEPMREAAEAAVRALPGVTSALVALTAEKAPGAAPARPGAAPSHPSRPGGAGAARLAIEGIGAIIAVASGKGGVGKSTTACNLALALAGQGLAVGVLDADIYGPSMPKLFGLSGKPPLTDHRQMVPLQAHGVKVMSIGFLIDPDAAMIWRGPMVAQALQQLVRDVAWGKLDVLVVDMPPGTGDAQLTLAQTVPLAGAVIVSTPQDLALIDARRGVAMFQKVEVPILGIVENMASFICPNCGTRHDIFGAGGAKAEAARIGVPFLGDVPLTMAIRETSDNGTPIVVSDPQGPQAGAYRAIAQAVSAQLAAHHRPAGPRIVFD